MVTDELFRLRDVVVGGIIDISDLVITAGVSCVTGGSGAGKTTMVKLLNGMVTPDRGTVSYRGTDLAATDIVRLRRTVVMLGQHPVVFAGTIADNVRIGCRWAGHPVPDDGQVGQLLCSLGLKVNPADDPGGLSGGEIQRLCLARVLAMNPEVLIADEPSAALDGSSEQLVAGAINRWRRATGASVVVVTHSPALVEMLGGTTIRMAAGTVVGEDAP
ncbi:ATP-binding cassette domain-containing protein [Corynebacterium sp. CCM 8862]|uniref:ATP-binding cassette domain-containing protein n=1 Tax=Corynebacterium mendelii TaxID=2765362 RepID=A0A939E005_9CORY|nr:ATP-binding cassette domain-containing protein [Corynebacterium mendelii]